MFFSSRKIVLKNWLDTSSIPCYLSSFSSFFFLTQSRHLLDTWWIDRESSCLFDSSSTLGGSIELLFLKLIFCCSILDRYLSCRQPLSRHLPRQLPQHLPIPQLSATSFLTHTSTASSTPPNTSTVEHY